MKLNPISEHHACNCNSTRPCCHNELRRCSLAVREDPNLWQAPGSGCRAGQDTPSTARPRTVALMVTAHKKSRLPASCQLSGCTAQHSAQVAQHQLEATALTRLASLEGYACLWVVIAAIQPGQHIGGFVHDRLLGGTCRGKHVG